MVLGVEQSSRGGPLCTLSFFDSNLSNLTSLQREVLEDSYVDPDDCWSPTDAYDL